MKLAEGYTHIFQTDITKFFDQIQHHVLLEILEKKISDVKFLTLLETILFPSV